MRVFVNDRFTVHRKSKQGTKITRIMKAATSQEVGRYLRLDERVSGAPTPLDLRRLVTMRRGLRVPRTCGGEIVVRKATLEDIA